MSQMSTGLSDTEHKLGSEHTGSADNEVWDKAALAGYLGISVSGLNKLIAARKAPPGFRVGRLWRWWRPGVRTWVQDREAENA